MWTPEEEQTLLKWASQHHFYGISLWPWVMWPWNWTRTWTVGHNVSLVRDFLFSQFFHFITFFVLIHLPTTFFSKLCHYWKAKIDYIYCTNVLKGHKLANCSGQFPEHSKLGRKQSQLWLHSTCSACNPASTPLENTCDQLQQPLQEMEGLFFSFFNFNKNDLIYVSQLPLHSLGHWAAWSHARCPHPQVASSFRATWQDKQTLTTTSSHEHVLELRENPCRHREPSGLGIKPTTFLMWGISVSPLSHSAFHDFFLIGGIFWMSWCNFL